MLDILKYDLKNFGLKTTLLHIYGKIAGDNFPYEISRQNILQKMSIDEMKPLIIESYNRLTGKSLDLDNPRTINEYIQWEKVYNSSPEKTRLADKYLVRQHIKETIGEEYLILLLGVWDDFSQIDFSTLPDQFVLKTNHGSATNIIVKDKNEFLKAKNLKAAEKKFKRWMQLDYAYKFNNFELHYSPIKRKIIAEAFMSQIDGDLYDYKFMCSKGKFLYAWVDTERFTGHKRNIFDRDWNPLKVRIEYPNSEKQIPAPKNLSKMIELAEVLSKDFSIVRVDFYEVEGKILFGELTFTSDNGTANTVPKEFEDKMGALVQR